MKNIIFRCAAPYKMYTIYFLQILWCSAPNLNNKRQSREIFVELTNQNLTKVQSTEIYLKENKWFKSTYLFKLYKSCLPET